MADFNEPRNDTLAELVLDRLKAQILSVAKLFIGTTDSNVPDGVCRYNESSNKFQKKNGASWDNFGFHATVDTHIADTALHSGVPVGSMLPFAGSTAPSGYLLCQGQAVSRTVTYAALFAAIGTSWGSGDGSTTFNIPDLRERFPLGRGTTGSFQTLGQTGGQVQHTHTTPPHQHTQASHVHGMKNHTHSTPNHSHTINDHTHNVNGHGHSAEYAGATIYVDSSGGAHQHNINRRANGGTYGSDNRMAMPSSSGSEDYVLTRNDTQGNHGHPHSAVKGRVGNAAFDGDIGFATSSASLSANSGGAGTSGGPSDNVTDGSGTITTTLGEGGSVTGVATPAYACVNYIIKY